MENVEITDLIRVDTPVVNRPQLKKGTVSLRAKFPKEDTEQVWMFTARHKLNTERLEVANLEVKVQLKDTVTGKIFMQTPVKGCVKDLRWLMRDYTLTINAFGVRRVKILHNGIHTFVTHDVFYMDVLGVGRDGSEVYCVVTCPVDYDDPKSSGRYVKVSIGLKDEFPPELPYYLCVKEQADLLDKQEQTKRSRREKRDNLAVVVEDGRKNVNIIREDSAMGVECVLVSKYMPLARMEVQLNGFDRRNKSNIVDYKYSRHTEAMSFDPHTEFRQHYSIERWDYHPDHFNKGWRAYKRKLPRIRFTLDMNPTIKELDYETKRYTPDNKKLVIDQVVVHKDWILFQIDNDATEGGWQQGMKAYSYIAIPILPENLLHIRVPAQRADSRDKAIANAKSYRFHLIRASLVKKMSKLGAKKLALIQSVLKDPSLVSQD